MQCEKGSLFCVGFLLAAVRGCDSGVSPLGGVFALLCAASAKVHPALVVSVLYPVDGGRAAGPAAEGGSDLVGGPLRRQRRHASLSRKKTTEQPLFRPT